ncbi:hypothetical protein [Aestuariirhabdus litorea]|uniref:Uncharacterized protein n=1 Tax=Aestuariirhabdus litorea TaxID=2528527 RepID=A0A3P3VS64_9GAMM|nr:hypothetical protein [Aestuariirhabdus litorea]RRJ85284.1 hypothetical protein D0544_09540 [Aestuariirhabdus litorea]RWW98505.1 hypothetical protein DZC74_09525 [Endozoicomonadaceae bacterium GTF-13]
MIEPELVDVPFLVAEQAQRPEEGYCDLETLMAGLQQAPRIGRYQADGRFQEDRHLMLKFHQVLPEMIEGVGGGPRTLTYGKYKLASLQKGSLMLHLEWLPEQVLGVSDCKFSFAQTICRSMGLEVLLLDLHGPVYEVLMPASVESMLRGLSFRAKRDIVERLRMKREFCIHSEFNNESREGQSVRPIGAFGWHCHRCPQLCEA